MLPPCNIQDSPSCSGEQPGEKARTASLSKLCSERAQGVTRGASLGYPAPVLFFLSSSHMISYAAMGSKVDLLPVLPTPWEHTGAVDTSAHFSSPLLRVSSNICRLSPLSKTPGPEYLWACAA